MPTAVLAPPELLLNPFTQSPVAKSLRHWDPRTDLGRAVREALAFLPEELAIELIERVGRTLVVQSQLSVRVFRPDGDGFTIVEDHGVVSRKVITNAGVNYLAAAFNAGASQNLFKFHGFGTGATAEAAADTLLVTELTTQYATASTRPTGSQANSTNTYTTVGTLSPSATVTIAEHGIFSASASGAVTLWDRSLTGSVLLTGAADSLQATYTASFSSGG